MIVSYHNPDVSKNGSGTGVISSTGSGGHCPAGMVCVVSGKTVIAGSGVFSGLLKRIPDGKKQERIIKKDKKSMEQTSNSAMIRILYRNIFNTTYRLSVRKHRYTSIFRKIRVIPG